AGPPPGRDPRGLHGLHHPGPVRRGLRARLQRALPESPIRRRPAARGLRGRRMTMHRRPLGPARTLAVLSAIVLIVASLLPCWTSGGRDALPATSGNAFEGTGILVFIVALGVIAIVTLPYAAGDRPGGAGPSARA